MSDSNTTPENGLDITTINIMGKQYEVVNANGHPEEIPDPFKIEKYPKEEANSNN